MKEKWICDLVSARAGKIRQLRECIGVFLVVEREAKWGMRQSCI